MKPLSATAYLKPHWHPAIYSYIEKVADHLLGTVPEDLLGHLCDETAYWLEQESRDFVLEGIDLDTATLKAVHAHGDPKLLASKMLEDYFECSLDSPVANGLGRANSIAGGTFGIANVLYLIFLQVKVYLPNSRALGRGYTPAEIRERFPEPLPYPDFTWQFFVTVGFPILAPFICGWICGRMIPVGAAGAVYRVMALIIICAVLPGAMLLPDRSGILYTVFLALYWLPVGCLTAHLSSSLLRRASRKRLEGSELESHPSAITQEDHPL